MIKKKENHIILYSQVKKVNPPLSLHGQILWREFFYCAATNNPKFDHMVGNSMCVQIPWDVHPEALAKWTNVSNFLAVIEWLLDTLSQTFLKILAKTPITLVLKLEPGNQTKR